MIEADAEYLRKREADERAAAGGAACMARTAHEDLAESYAERAEGIERASAEEGKSLDTLLSQLDYTLRNE